MSKISQVAPDGAEMEALEGVDEGERGCRHRDPLTCLFQGLTRAAPS